MTDLQIANMLADYHKECEAAETLREKADIQLKHARLIREALRQPLVSGRSEQLLQAYKEGFDAAVETLVGANKVVQQKRLQ